MANEDDVFWAQTNANPSPVLTQEKLNEAIALVKALTPDTAPSELLMLTGCSGLKVMRNNALPPDTIVVSEDLFNKLYDASIQIQNKKPKEKRHSGIINFSSDVI